MKTTMLFLATSWLAIVSGAAAEVLLMPRRKAKPVDPMEMGEQHGRCRWEGLREQDRLLVNQPAAVIAKQRRRCRAWLDGELSWSEVLGER